MPWKETCAMDERKRFFEAWMTREYTKTRLCAMYGISRPTGDKWIERAMAEGAIHLKDRSRAPHQHPNQTPAELVEKIVEAKLAHRQFGPKKVLDWLHRHYPQQAWPVDSTAGEILKRAGLVQPRRVRRRVHPDSAAFSACHACNELWSADFKGDFALGDRVRCYPLTVTDNYSRYLLQCQALTRHDAPAVRQSMQRVFREYGMPYSIRTDNGAPFASLAVGGLSALSKWWIQLGIRPQRIRPGKPGENGRHERMHRSLKQGCPPQANLAAQQHRFDTFRHEFNCERSHEALERATPAARYRPSTRPYPRKLPAVQYDSNVTVRYVHPNGEIRWRNQPIYLTQVLAKDHVGLVQVAESLWEIRYSFHLLCLLDDRTRTIKPLKSWHDQHP